jgi:hypothetical protein
VPSSQQCCPMTSPNIAACFLPSTQTLQDAQALWANFSQYQWLALVAEQNREHLTKPPSLAAANSEAPGHAASPSVTKNPAFAPLLCEASASLLVSSSYAVGHLFRNPAAARYSRPSQKKMPALSIKHSCLGAQCLHLPYHGPALYTHEMITQPGRGISLPLLVVCTHDW